MKFRALSYKTNVRKVLHEVLLDDTSLLFKCTLPKEISSVCMLFQPRMFRRPLLLSVTGAQNITDMMFITSFWEAD
jgi:hypothetical protein